MHIKGGYRAYSAVRVRTTHHVRDSFAQNADHFAHDTPLSAFFAEVVCTLGATPPRTATTPPRTATSPPPHGGNCTIRAATRRRHAVARLLMVQNPHRQRCDRRPCIQQQTRHITTVLRCQTTTSSHNRHLTCRRHSHPLNEVSTTQAKPQLACG